MTHGIGPGHVPRGNDAALLAAGIADMAVSGLTTVLRGVRGLLGRADMGELADEGRQELTARGRLALDRFAMRLTGASGGAGPARHCPTWLRR